MVRTIEPRNPAVSGWTGTKATISHMETSNTRTVAADRLLLTHAEVQSALGPALHVDVSREPGAVQALGNLVAAAAASSAYRSFSGHMATEGGRRPVSAAEMALVFDSPAKTEAVFERIGQAAHLRTKVGESSVAVETVTSAKGLVSYWGFIQLGHVIAVMTLDTLDPQDVSMSHFRQLVSAASARLERIVT